MNKKGIQQIKYLFVSFLSCVLAINSLSAQTQTQTVTIEMQNATMSQVMNSIEKQTKFLFVYDNDVDVNRAVSVNLVDQPLKTALDLMVKGSNVSYEFKGTSIVLSLNSQTRQSGSTQVRGFVRDANGQPISGATVIVKGTTTGTSTGSDGSFSLQVPAGAANPVLRVNFLGYEPLEVPVGMRTSFDIVMKDDTIVVDEVVVTALGIKKEAKSLSYSVQQVNSSEVTKIPEANFINSLSGKIAGVTINSASSGVGSSSRVIMRGTKSLFGNNNALYVIDGVPMFNVQQGTVSDRFEGAGQSGDALANINSDDIESVSVLSGASAAALYGSAAANGVVMVTTKRGEEGITTVNVSNSTTFSSPLTLPDFQNTYGVSEVGSFFSWGNKLSTPSSYKPRDFFQTGYSVNNSVNFSTGTDKNQTYVSIGNVTAEGIVRNNDYDRINFTFRNTTKFLKNKMTLDLQYMWTDIKEQNMIAQGEYHNPIVPVYLFPPGDDFDKVKAFQRYDPSRNLLAQYWPYDDGLGLQNPYWVTDSEKFINKKSRHAATASLRYDIAKGINLSGRFKRDESNESYERKFNASTNYPLFASKTGFYSLDHQKSLQMYGEVLLNIDKYIRDIVSITANIGASIDDTQFDQDAYGGKLAKVPNLFTYSNVAQSTAESSKTGYRKQKQSIFATAQIGYKGMVYLDLSGRNDWPSTLAGASSKSFFYPSVGLSGIVTDIFNIDTWAMPYMKVRASYSEVGNEPDQFLMIPTYTVANGVPVTQTRMFNPYLKPERTKSWEVGADFVFLGNALKLDFTYYHSRTYNQFFDVPLSSSSGYTNIYLNAGRIDNKGLELSTSFNKRWGKFSLNSYLTWSLNRNNIVHLLAEGAVNPVTGDAIELPSFDQAGTGNYKISLTEGGSMGDIYVTTLRVDEHGAIYVDPVSQTVIAEPNKWMLAGNSAPKYNLSFGNTFGWNGLSMSFLISARVGGVVVSNTQAMLDYYGVSQTSADARDNGGALVNGYRIVQAKEYYQTIAAPNGGAASMYVYSATNVRLGELTLGYDLPISKWTNNVVKGLNISFVGRNLFFFYKKAPFDPEVTASTGTYFQGIDYFMQPSLRNLGFSVKLKF